jgi:hypothetical protein
MRKDVEYTDHLKLRLRIRKIPEDYPKLIYENPDQHFFDNLEGVQISVKRLKYGGKLRNMMIAFEEKGDAVKIITVHPISDDKISNRIMGGRWTRK